ncbi:hypothetical protein [Flavobacterium gelatinilyticum]|uniref:hypothetical protein n=1 Tax=Flavobacterium gelatinilyticum TaxID=3003260 RepID=UPI0024818C5B|nr:hypothetical protein [Flavobacterium gelatinilyticum]
MAFIYHRYFPYKATVFYILIAVLCSFKITAQNDTLYFNQKWKNTSKDSAVYYRIKPYKVKTKDAVGYKIKNTDSLFVINDYYMSTNKLQFQGYSTDYNATYLVGKAKWLSEDGKDKNIRDFNYKENNNAPKFKIPELPIFYLDYKIATKSQFIGGLEFCLDCKNDNKLFLGLGFGITTYNGTTYGLPDLHLSYNTKNAIFFKGGTSDKHAYALAGITLLNLLDLGFGYSQQFNKDEFPIIKGFTFGATFRFASHSKNAYRDIKLM